MYKVTYVDFKHYPHVVLELKNISNRETKYWCYSELHYEEQCWQLEVKSLKGCTLSGLPQNGGWIDKKTITRL